jgi:pimeloyl-ACP methyl ester carboxylesterase
MKDNIIQDNIKQDNTMKLYDGRNLGFSESGKPDGIPLLLFHGTPGSRKIIKQSKGESWTEKFGIRLIVPERPGYGLSDPEPERTIKDWASDVEELVDYLELKHFHVVGGSGGGPYVLACAIHSSARILSANLICSGVPPEIVRLSKDMQLGNRIIFFLAKYAPFLLKRLFVMQANSVRKNPEKYAAKVLSKLNDENKRTTENQNEKDRKEGLATQMQEAYRQGVEGVYHDSLLIMRRPWGLNLDKIAVPVFMWHGIEDRLMPVALAREFSKLIPGCEAHFIPDIGHQLLGDKEVRSKIIDRMLSVSA